MTLNHPKNVTCQICKKEKALSETMPAEILRGNLVETIRRKYPEWSPSGFICLADLNRLRGEYVKEILEEEKGELSDLEKEVIQSVKDKEILSANPELEFERALSLGEHLSDKMADLGGSWTFLGIFFLILLVWISINTGYLLHKPFDPYPYILLNLILSCIAAVQAPIIMMSQNRQEAKDRLRATHDYSVNLKAELEIRMLHEKMDHLVSHQWQRLLEIQQIQTELMEEFLRTHPKK